MSNRKKTQHMNKKFPDQIFVSQSQEDKGTNNEWLQVNKTVDETAEVSEKKLGGRYVPGRKEMNNSLIVRNDALTVSFSPEALALKEAVLSAGALVGRVTTPDEQIMAVRAQTQIAQVMRSVETARKEMKQPVLAYGLAIDAAAKEFQDELDREHGRISNLVSEFQLIERRRVAAEQRLQHEELQKLEREKAEALATTKTVEEQQKVLEDFSRRAAVESQPIIAAKAEGQVSKSDWEIQVTNPYELARFHPQCVTITPKLGEIKALLAQKMAVRGVTAKEIIRSSVRARMERQIDV